MTSAEMLAFEARGWLHPGAKERAITDQFGMSPTRYYAALNRALNDPDTAPTDPVTVGRLLRLRESRAAIRGRRS